jgi:hypothetical protein
MGHPFCCGWRKRNKGTGRYPSGIIARKFEDKAEEKRD